MKTDAEEMKKNRAKKLRYKKPIVKNLNLETIQQDLWDIQESCEEVHWFTDSDDGSETLINALSGDEDEAYEFKMAFADLCAECERMFDDMQEEWVPDCFDILFVAAGAGETYGGLLGFDSYEQDYFGIGCSEAFAEDEAKKKLKQMTKDELIAAVRQCFRIYSAYIGLRNRYDSLKAAIDILREQNTGHLQVVREIERLYQKAQHPYSMEIPATDIKMIYQAGRTTTVFQTALRQAVHLVEMRITHTSSRLSLTVKHFSKRWLIRISCRRNGQAIVHWQIRR